jgi:hypothetical protein
MSPVSSATGTKSAGDKGGFPGRFQRRRASTPTSAWLRLSTSGW